MSVYSCLHKFVQMLHFTLGNSFLNVNVLEWSYTEFPNVCISGTAPAVAPVTVTSEW